MDTTARYGIECAVSPDWEWKLTSWRVAEKLVKIIGITTCVRDILQLRHKRTIEWEYVRVRLVVISPIRYRIQASHEM